MCDSFFKWDSKFDKYSEERRRCSDVWCFGKRLAIAAPLFYDHPTESSSSPHAIWEWCVERSHAPLLPLLATGVSQQRCQPNYSTPSVSRQTGFADDDTRCCCNDSSNPILIWLLGLILSSCNQSFATLTLFNDPKSHSAKIKILFGFLLLLEFAFEAFYCQSLTLYELFALHC